MRILFITNHKDSPSTVLNVQKLQKLNRFKNVRIDFYNENYDKYDVVLFMGYDHEIEKAKSSNQNIKVGIIDPRPTLSKSPTGADFILSNGIEMKDWCYQFTSNILDYYIYPELPIIRFKDRVMDFDTNKRVIGYHGNLVHLNEMHPRITNAIEFLADKYEIEFRAIYNRNLGKWKAPFSNKISVQHIDWEETVYEKKLIDVHVGIVPGLIPFNIKRTIFLKKKSLRNKYKADKTDYFLRFKGTSNPGRIFVFNQLGIPVIADFYPSSLQTIDDGINGRICYSTESWIKAFEIIFSDSERSRTYSDNAQQKFKDKYTSSILNSNLIQFIKQL